eukprot:TRINITY_DN6657_c0_g1_i1.p1 TRINITY_DN6657_c0_g1~~TRINITY_DN6657_c0_g1_i1.p1  ORF type:complete len:253 (-),score=56.33 TRINITY_DN6657_c0_g1_i1:11-769(-)
MQGNFGFERPEDKDLEISLYDVIKYYREDIAKPISRLFYACGLKDQEKAAKTEFLNSIASSIKSIRAEGKRITGFMLVKGSYIIHFLESDSATIYEYLRKLQKDSKLPKTPYERINVLALNEEIAEDTFPDWEMDEVFQTGQVIPEGDRPDDQMLEKVWNVYSGFIKTGLKLKEKHRRDEKVSKQAWKELTSEISFGNDEISIMLSPKYMNIDDYLAIYESDLEIVLDDELAFPQPPRMSKILEYYDNGTFK